MDLFLRSESTIRAQYPQSPEDSLSIFDKSTPLWPAFPDSRQNNASDLKDPGNYQFCGHVSEVRYDVWLNSSQDSRKSIYHAPPGHERLFCFGPGLPWKIQSSWVFGFDALETHWSFVSTPSTTSITSPTCFAKLLLTFEGNKKPHKW